MRSIQGHAMSGRQSSGYKILLTAVIILMTVSVLRGQNFQRKVLVRGKPDLKVALAPDPPARSSPVPLQAIRTLWVTVSNTGAVSAQDFYVDLYITQNVPSSSLSQPARGMRTLKEGRQHVQLLRGGATTRVGIPLKDRIPAGLSAGEYVITAFVDPTRKISELSETNNTALFRIKIDQTLISTIEQDYHQGMSDWLVLDIKGLGFGSVQGTRSVLVGSQALTIIDWADTRIHGYVTLSQVSLGINYEIRLADSSTKARISNSLTFMFMARIYLVEPTEAAPGTQVKLWVADRGGNTQGSIKVKLGTVEVQVTSWPSGEAIYFNVPSVPPGKYELYLEDSGRVTSNKWGNFRVL